MSRLILGVIVALILFGVAFTFTTGLKSTFFSKETKIEVLYDHETETFAAVRHER